MRIAIVRMIASVLLMPMSVTVIDWICALIGMSSDILFCITVFVRRYKIHFRVITILSWNHAIITVFMTMFIVVTVIMAMLVSMMMLSANANSY